MGFSANQTFEPRVATAQMIFGIIYVFITLIALTLAFYVQTEKEPYLYYFMAALFAIMALKSFIICARVRTLMRDGVYHSAKVDSIEAVRGITVIKGTCEVEGFGPIYIESRLVGETPARELKKFLEDHNQEHLPALVVAIKTRPRGMFTVKCKNGHLDDESAMLKDVRESDLDKLKAQNAEFAAQNNEEAIKEQAQAMIEDIKASANAAPAAADADADAAASSAADATSADASADASAPAERELSAEERKAQDDAIMAALERDKSK